MPSQKIRQPVRPSRTEAEDAVRVLIRWAGDDPKREGLRDTPSRVVKAYEEFFAGYSQDPREILARTFSEVEGYDETYVKEELKPMIARFRTSETQDARCTLDGPKLNDEEMQTLSRAVSHA